MDPHRNTRRGCDCACRNLTMPQLVKTSSDHLKCLLKEDIIKLCRYHDISFEPWKPKGFLIKCLKDHIYYPPKDINIQNLCDHSIYLCCQSIKSIDKFYFDEKIDRIEPYENGDYTFKSDESSDISKLVITKDKPMCGELNSVYLRYEDITNILYEGTLSEINDTIVIKSDDESQWKTATLKLNFLMKELKRLGADKHETYSCIIDLHQDIVIPHDKE